MLVQKIAVVVGTGALLAVATACGGGVPDPPEAAGGAATVNPTDPAKAGTSPSAPTTPPAGSAKTPAPSASSSSEPPANKAPPDKTPAPPGAGDPGNNGQDGAPGRVAVGDICCFGGKFFRCPDTNACLGNADPNACIANCDRLDVDCIEACVTNLDGAGPPVGCDGNATPPPGVDCANGNVNVQK
jgi:hypothetical protein